MLSVFPQILFLAPIAATLIRLALAALYAYAAWRHAERSDVASRTLALGEVAVTISLLLGVWAQPGALLGAIISAIWVFQPSSRVISLSTALLSFVMCFSLLLTGAGAFAFDLPL